ncbi:MAG TPA: glycosyltransferase family 4 protein [Syntrophomonas sp.]|nr:glycosyltransferase family 4 protein [Syntrophomonas sp.]
MKTIWILNHHAVTPDIGGGTRHYDFGRELVKRGYQVYIFASSFIHYQYINVLNKNEKTKEMVTDGIHWVWINTREYRGNGKNRILGMIDYYRFMMKNYGNYPRPDVIIGSAVHLLACAAGCRISRKAGSRFISEIRDLWPETLIELGTLKRNGAVARALFALEDYVYQKSEKIIVTAPGMADYIAQKGISRERIIYINNGVDVSSFDKRKQGYKPSDTAISFDHDAFNVVYVGAIGTANALDTLLEAAKKLKDKGTGGINFTMIGTGPLKGQLMKKTEEYRLENFKYYDAVAKHYVPGLLSMADCLIFSAVDSPLYRFGISANKLFDYMCSGKPVIFAINTINDFIQESGGGISIDPENADQMADAILSLYGMSEADRDMMGAKGRQFAEKNFDIPILVNKLEEVING